MSVRRNFLVGLVVLFRGLRLISKKTYEDCRLKLSLREAARKRTQKMSLHIFFDKLLFYLETYPDMPLTEKLKKAHWHAH